MVSVTQVPECEGPNPRPQVQTWSGSNHAINVLPRWPNVTGWRSAWELDGRHVLQYNISDGWLTNLVTGQDSGTAEYWFQGSRRVVYANVTQHNSTYVLPGWPQTSNWSDAYGADAAAASRNFYFATLPFNVTQNYRTSYKVWGNFTVYVTHLSNNDTTIACHDSAFGPSAAGNCTIVAKRHLQCPFTFRCFSPEMGAGGGPRCLDDFDHGYNDTDALNTLPNNTSPKEVYGTHSTALCLSSHTVATFL